MKLRRKNSRLQSVADDDGRVLDAVGGPGLLGLLCVVCAELKAGNGAFWAYGVGPDHAGVADIDADFEDYEVRCLLALVSEFWVGLNESLVCQL